MNGLNETHGRKVIESLAEVYQQLYIPPGEGAAEKYAAIVQRGQEAECKDLSHFKGSGEDSLLFPETPEGRVCVVTLYERQDFVTFLRIMANRCTPVEIPDTQGASLISGVINWTRIRAREKAFFEEEKEKGVIHPDWEKEFERFTSDKRNYLDVVIVLSVGPYSGIRGTAFGIPEEEWIKKSNTIRLYHECTHYICRKRYPDKKDPVWDEIVADAVGIYAAFGKYDPDMEGRFLGIEKGCYIGGRLENYVTDLSGEEKREKLDELAHNISGILEDFNRVIPDANSSGPFDIIDILEQCRV